MPRTLLALLLVAAAVLSPNADAASAAERQQLTRLAAEVQAAEDVAAIKRLQRSYGYYLDKGMWADLAEFFTADAVANFPAGVFIGKESIRRHLYRNVGGVPLGQVGLGDGRVHNHLNLQPVVHLDAGGRRAWGRWRELAFLGGPGRGADWGEGIYLVRYAKVGGVWKIERLDYHTSFAASFAAGWVPPAAPANGVASALSHRPDRERDRTCDGFAAACIAPFHYGSAELPAGGNLWRAASLRQRPLRGEPQRVVAQLQQRVDRLQDEQSIENLIRIYGYYVDRAQWSQVADLFAEDARLEMDQRGVYVGKDSIRRFLSSLAPEGLRAGLLFEHLQLQPVVHVAPDGLTARARSRQLVMRGEHGGESIWSEGIFENHFVRQDGVWKFQSLRYYPTLVSDFAKGWAVDAQPAPGIDPAVPPDLPPTESYAIYPKAHVPPFHYRNPVTGDLPTYPLQGGPAAERARAELFDPPPARTPVGLPLASALPRLEKSLGRVRDYHEIENLQGAYGYYLDKNQWTLLAGLFAPEGSIELALRGVYRGARVKPFLLQVFGRGSEGPVAGRLGNHIQLQPVIHVEEGGTRAQVRVRMLQQMSQGPRASLGAAVYENEVVKQDGVWRFARVNAYNTLSAGYVGGWTKAAGRGMPGPSAEFPPDGPPTREVAMYPILREIPYHYANPVSGSRAIVPAPPLADQLAQFPLAPAPAPAPVPPPVPPPVRPAGMEASLAERLRAIGPKIDGAATAPLYAPLHAGGGAGDGVEVRRDLAYGPHERHRADVFIASAPGPGSRRPVLVFIHGGGFVRGAKSSPGSPFFDNIGRWAARQGLLGVTVNYRLAPEHAYPAGAEDLERLLGWLRGQVGALGGDPSRIVFWGHSAGAAHVADFLVRNPGRPLAGAVLTSGIYSLGPDLSPWKDYYGSDPALYPARQSLERLAASPVPLLVNHAELDPPAFVADTLALLRARAATGQPTRQLRLASHSHISETYAIGTADLSLSAPVLEFIRDLPATRLRR